MTRVVVFDHNHRCPSAVAGPNEGDRYQPETAAGVGVEGFMLTNPRHRSKVAAMDEAAEDELANKARQHKAITIQAITIQAIII